jgi:TPR repeat protein
MKYSLYPAAAFIMMGLLSSTSFAVEPAPAATPAAPANAAPATVAGETKSDPQHALETLGAAAEKGDNAAIFQIGRAYVEALQYDEAEKWLQRAAENNYVAAQMELARLYFMTAQGDREKEKKAAAWVRRAADSGDANAQMALALLYQKGLGVEKNDKEAARVFEKLSQVGHPGAQYNLGIMHRDGVGVEKNPAKAAALLSLAVQGYKEGPTRNQIVRELQDIKSGLSQAELSQSKSIYEHSVMYFQAMQQHGGQSGDLARPELPSAQGVQPKEKAVRKTYDLSGFVQAGVRWQDNANGAPPASAGGARPSPDSNFFAMASVNLISPPKIGVIENFDTRAVLYQTRQRDQANSDLGFAELSTGPNINITTDGKYSVRPYLTANTIKVDGDLYQLAGGIGASFVGELTKDSAVVLNAEDVYINFNQAPVFPDNNESDGTQFVFSARGLKRTAPWLTVDLGATWRNVEAKKDWRSSDSIRVSNGYSIKLPVLMPDWSPRPASLYASIAYKRGWYEEPDASIVPGIRRSDNEWQGTVTGEFPVRGDWSVVPTLQKTIRTANAPLYESSNAMGSLVVMYKF